MRLRYFSDALQLRRIVRNPWQVALFREKREPGAQLEVRFRRQPALRLRSGFPDHHMFHRIFLRDEYHLGAVGERRWGTVIDLGGNVGVFSARVAPWADRVLTFEPVPENYETLASNLAEYPSVTALQCGVSDEAGALTMHRPKDRTLSGVYSAHESLDGDLLGLETFEVPVTTLDTVFDEHAIDKCDLLKIDIEGHEYAVLMSASRATLSRIDKISGEYHCIGDGPKMSDLQAWLEDHGFGVDLEPHRRKQEHGMFFASR